MLPLLPFAAGLAVGAAAVSMLRSERARAGLEKAQQTLRDAAAASAAALRRSSAAVKRRFEEAPIAETGVAATKPKAAKAPRRKPAAKPAAPRRARKAAPKPESEA